jgi:hypothetical protein
MPANSKLQRQIVSKLKAQRPEEALDLSNQLWGSITAELIPIIGEDGFAILYARALHHARSAFPWLAAGPAPHPADTQFTSLRLSLQDRPIGEARVANEALLLTFTDLLAVLIGEPLTAGLLRAALGR